MSTAPVVCAGLVVADHVSPPLDHLPRSGELVAVEDLVLNIGGGAANTAVDLARLGVTASICARVGDDIFGRFAAETMQSRGVDCSGLKVEAGRSTSQTLVVNVRGEDRRFIHTGGANNGFRAEDLDVHLNPPPRVLHIGYFLILPNLEAHALADRFKKSRAGGTFTLLDVAIPGPDDYIDRLKVVLPETDLFVPNTDEAALILGETDPIQQARAFREMGARRVVITMGERGMIAMSDELQVRMGTYPTTFVDGSGGGDAFNAGYIVGVLEGRSELDCLKLAGAVGASCARAVGTTEGVFTREEAEVFLRANEATVERLD